MAQRYFNAIKNKTHALGIAYINRDLTQQEIGKENPVTHKKNTITKIVSESRKVKFRDDSYTADSKSRLRYIVDEVNLDEHEIIKALEDAIAEEKKNPYKVENKTKTTKKKAPKVEEPVEEPEVEIDEDLKAEYEAHTGDEMYGIEEDIFEDELETEEEAIAPVDKGVLAEIRAAFKNGSPEAKAEVKTILGNYGGKLANEMRPSDVVAIKKILDI
jgi:hypothetical protein